MTLNEAKTELKKKGYSIRTTYNPKQCEVLEILYNTRIVAEFHYIELEHISDCFISDAMILLNKL